MLYLAIPALNEAATIGVLLWRLRSVLAEFPREYEVVVYDDASSDVTSEVLEPYTKVLPLTILRGERTVGYAGAVDALVRYVSRQTRYPRRDAMLLLQADFTDPPALVPEFAKRFEGGADIVIGERSQSADTPMSVRRLLRVTPWVTRPFVRVEGVRDITSSFRLIRISVLRDLIRAAGDAPVCVGDELTANADFLLRAVPLARRVETLVVEPTFGVRTRETRRIAMRDGIALARWAWRARGRRVAPSTAPEAPTDNSRSQRDTRNESRNDFRTDPRAEVRVETRTEVRVEAKHEPRLEARTNSRGEARPNPRNDARREARREARGEIRKKDRKNERDEVPREYGNDQLYDLNAESRAVAAAGVREPAPADEAETPAPSDERRSKRPRPKRRKRGQRRALDADGNPTTVGDDDAEAPQSAVRSDDETSDDFAAESTVNSEASGDGESSEVDRAKRPRKKRRKRGSRRNRNADGTSAEIIDASMPTDGAEPHARHASVREENDDDGQDSNGSDTSETQSGDEDTADSPDATDGTDAPRARRRGRRGRRGGARRSRSSAAEGSSSNDGAGAEPGTSHTGIEPSGESQST